MPSPPGKNSIAGFFLRRRATLFLLFLHTFVFFALCGNDKGRELARYLVLTPAGLMRGYVHSLFTAAFLHVSPEHLAYNMLGVFVFGGVVESRFGARVMYLIYFSAILISMLLTACVSMLCSCRNCALVGASGGVMGLLSCAMLAAPYKITYEVLIPLPVFLKAWVFLGIDLCGLYAGADVVARLAHLFGFASLAVTASFLSPNEKKILRRGVLINLATLVFFSAAYLKFR